MYYKIHADRIILEDENGTRAAEIDYPEIRSGLCEITHVYGSEDEEGLRQASNLMDLCVREIRQSGRKVIASSKYAASWFDQHPDARDVLIDSSVITADRYGEFDLGGSGSAAPASAVSEKRVSQNTVTFPLREELIQAQKKQSEQTPPAGSYHPDPSADRLSRQTDISPDTSDDWDRTDRILRGEAGHDSGRQQSIRRRSNPFREETPRRRRRAKKASSGFTPILSICRILQVVSFLSMIGILLFYLASVFLHSSGFISALGDGAGGRTFALLSVVFLLFCLIEAFWILTRRRERSRLRNQKIDPGRGLFAFIVVLIIRILCRSITVILPSSTGIFDGMIQFASVFEAYGIAITLLAILGIILCIVRRVISR